MSIPVYVDTDLGKLSFLVCYWFVGGIGQLEHLPYLELAIIMQFNVI